MRADFRPLWRAQGQISKVAKAAILRISASTKAPSFTACGSALIRSRYGPPLAYRALQKIRPDLWTKQLANFRLLWRAAQGQISKVAKAVILRISSSTKAPSFTTCRSALIRSR